MTISGRETAGMRPETITRRPLHICIFADERSVHTQRWVLGLRGLGHRVDLITLIKNSEKDIGGISLMARSKISYLTKIGRLRRLVGKLNPDIFHAHYASSFGFLASFVDHPRKILSVWGDDVIVFPYANPIFRAIVKRALRHSRRITATSEFLRAAVGKLAGIKNEIEVIPFGIDLSQFVYVERETGPTLRIGITKSLRPKYGIDVLIDAFAVLSKKHENLELIVAGRGEQEAAYKRKVRDMNLTDRITFVGFIDHSKLPELFGNIDIFVMPSVSDGESFGVAALEASATGLAVVASRVGGVPEVVQDGVTGYLVERRNIEALAETISRLVADANLRRKMGRAGREFVEKNYNWNDNLMQMQSLYYSLRD
jgi:glycosyltransferase involved in cell wall biosynthesis